jgi:hypothetical protein
MHKIIQGKATAFRLSDQVLSILHEQGLSKIFNFQDYKYFKSQCNTAFDKAQAIAERFIEDNNLITSDYNDYVY